MTIGELIQYQRKKLNFTLEDVGRVCNVPRSTVYRWEQGQIRKIARDKQEALCNMLGIDPVVFFFREEALSRDEMKMLIAYREADKRAKEDAIKMLNEHKEFWRENDDRQRDIQE